MGAAGGRPRLARRIRSGWAPRSDAADRKPPGRAASGPSVICFYLFIYFLFFSPLHDSRFALWSLLCKSRRDAPSRARGLRGAAWEPGAPDGPGRPPGPEAWAFGSPLRRPLLPALGAPGPGPGPAERRALPTGATQPGPNRPSPARSLSEPPPARAPPPGSPLVGFCPFPAVRCSMGGVLLSVPPAPFLNS